MLYYHFGSKRALYVEVLRDMFRAVSARARAIADGPGTATEKLDTWIVTIVAEAALRPWFPPMMLRELASGAPRFDPDTFAMMNAVFAAVRDVIVQGQREQVFRDADPLLTHLTIMPPVLIFFARQRLVASTKGLRALAAPRQVADFVRHMQASARGMLRRAGCRCRCNGTRRVCWFFSSLPARRTRRRPQPASPVRSRPPKCRLPRTPAAAASNCASPKAIASTPAIRWP